MFNQFINTGLDDRILKSLPVENVSEDLVKSMNKQGLVQKEVQVKGKNGKMFTRKQWVRAGEGNGSGKPTQPKTDTSTDSNKTKKQSKFDWNQVSQGVRDNIIKDVKDKLGQNDIHWGTPSSSGTKTTCELQQGDKTIGEIIIDTSNPNKPVVSSQAMLSSVEASTDEGIKTREAVRDAARAIQKDLDGQTNSSSSDKSDLKTYTDKSSNTINVVGKITKDQEKQIVDKMKAKGLVIDKEHTGNLPGGDKQLSFKKPNDKPDNNSQSQKPKANYFKATQATKDKVNELGNKMGNDKLLEFAKQNNVSWTEHSHKGINIMRAKMALAQAIQEGKIDLDKSSSKDTKTDAKNSDKLSDSAQKIVDELKSELSKYPNGNGVVVLDIYSNTQQNSSRLRGDTISAPKFKLEINKKLEDELKNYAKENGYEVSFSSSSKTRSIPTVMGSPTKVTTKTRTAQFIHIDTNKKWQERLTQQWSKDGTSGSDKVNYKGDTDTKTSAADFKAAKKSIFDAVKKSRNINDDKEYEAAIANAPVGTTFSVRVDNPYHECFETFTKVDNNTWTYKYTYPSKEKGKFESWGNTPSTSDIWNSIRSMSYEVDSVPESTSK